MRLLVSWIFLFVPGLLAADQKKLDIGYYENLSMITFFYSQQLYSIEGGVEERLAIARDSAFMMFVYWSSSRRGDVASSAVDKAIRKVYHDTFKNSELDEVGLFFRDPLLWMTKGYSPRHPKKEWAPADEKDYQRLLIGFHEFLNENPAKKK